MILKNSFLLILGLFFSFSSFAANSCIEHYNGHKANRDYFKSLVNINLFHMVAEEISFIKKNWRMSSPSHEAARRLQQTQPQVANLAPNKIIQALNKITLNMLNEYQPNKDNSDNRLDTLDKDLAYVVLKSLNKHPVASFEVTDRKYSRTDREVGYCFGRAMYYHEMLLRLGIDETSIKKIWAVGPMKAGNITWDFHVATMARLKTGQWVVLDEVYHSYRPGSELPTSEQWYQLFQSQSANKDLRIFITEPEKFAVPSLKYGPIDLGLNLSHLNDYYKGYFKDLQAWFASMIDDNKLATFLGLAHLPLKPRAIKAKQKEEAEEKRKREEEEQKQKLQQGYGIDPLQF